MSQNESGTKRATNELPHSPKKPRLDEENTANSPMSISMEDENEPGTLVTVTEIATSPEMKENALSDDLIKAVTPSPNTQNNQINEDTSITSEQLLLALTSIPPDIKPPLSSSSNEISEQPQEEPALSKSPIVNKETAVEEPVALNEAQQMIEDTPAPDSFAATNLPTEDTAQTREVEDIPVLASELPLSSNISKESTFGRTATPDKVLEPPPLSPKVVNQGPSLSHATSLALNNLPDISAALRRLSNAGVSASVIEQLSSSSSNTGQTNEKKLSTEATPSEILGNALAAVAASARANGTNPQQASHALVNGTSENNNNDNSSSNINNGNTAAAIGNLAAITANISNILTSSGFNRGSFSQEDTQKLAAAVAGVTNNSNNNNSNNTLARRNSSITAVGNAFSNMIDQAIMIRRNKSISTPSQTLSSSPQPKLIIKNEQVWKYMEGIEEKSLGYHLYSPQQLLPNLENCLNGVMEIRIPAKYLSFENIQVKKRAIWGTDIYTDDSDIVAMIIHSGKYQPEYKEPEVEPNDPFALAIAGKPREAMEASRKQALSGKKWVRQDTSIPDHDLKVTIRVLPKLQNYTGSIRNCVKSRDWGKHDGMSLFVNKIEKIKKGDARLKGRSSLKAGMFIYEPYRKQALGLDKKEEEKEERRIQKGRIKKTQRVMRMFQLHSNNNISRKE
ncbi:unnamed protein product [Rhizopus stolonifer]